MPQEEEMDNLSKEWKVEILSFGKVSDTFDCSQEKFKVSFASSRFSLKEKWSQQNFYHRTLCDEEI